LEVHQHSSLPKYTHFRHAWITIPPLISSEDTEDGSSVVTAQLKDSPSMTVAITWLLTDAFTIAILGMDFALHAEYSDVVPCGAYVVVNNYPTDGPAIINDSIGLLKSLN